MNYFDDLLREMRFQERSTLPLETWLCLLLSRKADPGGGRCPIFVSEHLQAEVELDTLLRQEMQ